MIIDAAVQRYYSSANSRDLEEVDDEYIYHMRARLAKLEIPADQELAIFDGQNAIRALNIWKNIFPEDTPDPPDNKYDKTLQGWSQIHPKEYVMAIHEMRTLHGDEFTDGFIEYLTKKKTSWAPRLSEVAYERLHRYAR